MEQIMNYVKPELIVVAIVLYFIGLGFKKAQYFADKHIPAILGVVGVALCGLWVFANCPLSTYQEVLMAVFTSIVQGLLVAGLSVYVNQLIKQAKKQE
ncbi:MAG: phage holin family protein [Eubacteriales bacterium]|nr:phage holin family protein [Eubacteriales bacterium]